MAETTIIIFKGQSQYDVLRYFADELGQAFEQYGYRVIYVDLINPDYVKKLQEVLIQGNILFALGFGGIGIDIKVDNQSIYDYLGIPYFAYFVDDPIFLMDRISEGVQNAILSFVDNYHVKYVDDQSLTLSSKMFLPHAADKVNTPIKAINERQIDILLPGTIDHPDLLRRNWLELGPVISRLMDEIAEHAYFNRDVMLADSMQEVLSRRGLGYNNWTNQPNALYLLNLINKYVRARSRIDALEELADYNVHIYGNGWDQIKGLSKTFKIFNSIGYDEIREKMKDSKIVLTTLPTFIEGGHERIFSSMQAGAVSLVDNNQYLSEKFSEKEIVLFSWKQKNISHKVATLFQDNSLMQTIADNGRYKVINEHQWIHRAEKILEAVFIHKLLKNS